MNISNDALLYGSILLIFTISLLFVPDMLTFIPIWGKPFDEVPWYFITQDFRMGVAAILGLLISFCMIGLYVRKRGWNVNARSAVFFSTLSFGIYIMRGVIILIKTSNILEPTKATTSWENHDSYLHSPNYIIIYSTFVIALLILFLIWNNLPKLAGT